MAKCIIESTAGAVFGVYEGETKRDAFMAMLAASGDASAYGEAHVGTEAGYHINPYEGTLWINDSSRGTEAIKKGVEAAHKLFIGCGVSPRAAWEAAQARADGRSHNAFHAAIWDRAEVAALDACDAGEHGVLVLEG